MISTKPVSPNVRSSIRDNLLPDSNIARPKVFARLWP
jgi:hypothetical protein